MKILTIILACIAFVIISTAITSADPIDFRVCMEKESSFELKNVDMTPVTPTRGVNVTIKMEGIAKDPRTDSGTIETKILLKNIPVFEFRYDLCKVSLTGCPIMAGEWAGVLVQPVPKIAFPGVYTSHTVSKVAGEIVSCVEFDFEVRRE